MEETNIKPIGIAPILVKKSDSIVEIAKALSKFQASMVNVTKEAENPYFKSSYASLGNIIDTIRKPMGENGLAFAQFPIEDNRLVTLLMHTSGEYFQSVVKMFPKDSTPQAQGSAITYMRRYALSAILGIATEDDDGNDASTTQKTTTVKTGKGTDEYAKAVLAIEKAKDIKTLEEMLQRLDKSDKFTDGEKNKLEKLISEHLDMLTIKNESVVVPEK